MNVWRLSRNKILAACSIAGLTAFGSPAFADQLFTAVNGSASADFTAGNGTLTLVLSNLQGLPHSLADLLSDISFSVDNGGAIHTGGSSPTPTDTSPVICTDNVGCSIGGSIPAWHFSSPSSGSYYLNSLDGGPAGMIAPSNMLSLDCTTNSKCPDGLGGTVNKLGNGQPFLLGSATFNLAIDGVTTDSKISNVVFSFGTGPETFVGVPIPAAAWLFGSGLLGLIGIARRRNKANDSTATPALA